ncbi:hypothetical protein [Leptolyngbya sp. BC1307]
MPIEVYDHDWATLATGKVIPHGLYDLSENTGYGPDWHLSRYP